MKRIIVGVMVAFGGANLRAGGFADADALAANFLDVVEMLSDAKFAQAINEFWDSAPTPVDPRQRQDQASQVQEQMQTISQLGPARAIDELSRVLYGGVYLRVRFLERRDFGYVLYTIYGQKVDGRWHSLSFTFTGSSDFMEVAKQFDVHDGVTIQKEKP